MCLRVELSGQVTSGFPLSVRHPALDAGSMVSHDLHCTVDFPIQYGPLHQVRGDGVCVGKVLSFKDRAYPNFFTIPLDHAPLNIGC